MLLVKQFWPYSDSWHITVNCEIKHTMHRMGVQSVGVHNVDVFSMGLHHRCALCTVLTSVADPNPDPRGSELFLAGTEFESKIFVPDSDSDPNSDPVQDPVI